MPIFVGAASSLVIRGNSVGVGTTTTAGRNAGVGTPFGMTVYNVDTEQLEVYDNGDWTGGLSVPIDATGGSKNTSSRTGFNVHTFTSSGSIVIDQGVGYVEYVVVAGGGGGGQAGTGNGGGGGGGFRSGSFYVTPGTYPVTIGSGGGFAGKGQNSSFGPPSTPERIESEGGGGGTAPGGPADDGGSGGGGYGANGTAGRGNAANRDIPEGFPGGRGGTYPSPSGFEIGGGGGGAGGAGGTGQAGPGAAGAGGPGRSTSITGSPQTFGGGGGGGTYQSSGTGAGAGGPGGGGPGGNGGPGRTVPQMHGTNGTANTGGGGGGGGSWSQIGSGGEGGSGIIIIAYPTS